MKYSQRSKVALALALALGTGAVVALLFSVYAGPRAHTVSPSRHVIDQMHEGDYAGALAYADTILASQTATPDEKALVRIKVATIPYERSRNIEDAVASIRLLREIATDETLSPTTRMAARTQIALWYRDSNNNERVFEEIFSDPTYSQYRAPAGKTASIRNVLIAADNDLPKSFSSIAIASSYISQLFGNTPISASVKENYLAEAEAYLKRAESLLAAEFEHAPRYEEFRAVSSYFYWSAYTMGGLAYFKVSPYTTLYRTAYDTLNKFIANGTPDQKRLAAIARWRFATYLLLVDNDATAAQRELDAAISLMRLSPDQNHDALFMLLRELKDRAIRKPTDPLVGKLKLTMQASARFEQFVNELH